MPKTIGETATNGLLGKFEHWVVYKSRLGQCAIDHDSTISCEG